jgi:hypothetical protein
MVSTRLEEEGFLFFVFFFYGVGVFIKKKKNRTLEEESGKQRIGERGELNLLKFLLLWRVTCVSVL